MEHGSPPHRLTAGPIPTDRYHGVDVPDGYRWLEDGEAPAVQAWIAAQTSTTRRTLDAWPRRAHVRAALRHLLGQEAPAIGALAIRPGRIFALKSLPPRQQPFLVTMEDESGRLERTLVDPNVIDPTGQTTIDWFEPSWDGERLAASLSRDGTEDGTLHVFDVRSGEETLVDTIPRVSGATAGGSVAWLTDGSGFFYTRYPGPEECSEGDLGFHQEVWFHQLGRDHRADARSLGSLPRVAATTLRTSPDGRLLLASVAHGDGGDLEHWVLRLEGAPREGWTRIAMVSDEVRECRFSPDGSLFLRSTARAPRGKVSVWKPGAPVEDATTIIEESDVVIARLAVTETLLFTADLVGGPYQVRVFDHDGAERGTLPIAPSSSVWDILPARGDDVFLRMESYLEPSRWSRYRAETRELRPTVLARPATARFDDIEVRRESCVSRDGTSVPMNILSRRDLTLGRETPVVLYGYGGFGLSESPWFDPTLRLWFDAGGAYVSVNLRGGGELGETWRRDGQRTKKQNVFDDFLAAARHLIDRGWTSPSRLAIMGASNGGLLMGAAMTQAPELFAAVVAWSGIYDMLRAELTPNGSFNVSEYGSVLDEEEFHSLHAFSPFHQVRDGVRYPPTLLLAGGHDQRVDPFHSRKMVARLQQANASRSAILLRHDEGTGHGLGTPLDAQVEEQADVWSFLMAELGCA